MPSQNTPIQLVAIDLDGTLLTDTKQVSRKTLVALQSLASQQVKVVIASARPPRSVRAIYHSLGLDTWQINYNGALIWDEPTQEPIFHRPMKPAFVRRVIDDCRQSVPDLTVTVEILDRWHTDRPEDKWVTETGKMFKPDVIASLDEICSQPITKLILLADPEAINELEPIVALAHSDHVSVVRTDPHMLQIMDLRVSKAMALQHVAAHYGIPMRHVMSIGDAPNDVGMLQVSGVAVAMDNAHGIVKRVSHWVAPSNNDHGVHAALVRYGLCK
jgi:Cof subfamily protein (haloacid dehalogenase superfamily)